MTIEEVPTSEVVGDDAVATGRFGGTVLISTLSVMAVAVGVRLLVSVFGYALQVLVSRSATTAEYGRYAFAASVALAFGGLASRGADQLILQQGPRFVAASPVFLSGLRRFVVRRTVVGLLVAIPLSVVLLALNEDSNTWRSQAIFAALTAGTIVAAAFGNIENAWLSAHGRPVVADTITFLGTAVFSCAVFLAIGVGLGRRSGVAALLSVLLGTGFAVVIIHVLCRAVTSGFESSDPGELTERHWKRVGNKFFMVALCQAASGRTIVLALGLALDPSEFALLFAAWKMATLLDLPHAAIGSWAAPRFSGARDSRTMQPLLTTISQFMTTIGLVLGSALIVLRGPLLGVFGHQYRSAATAFVILLIGQAFIQLFGPIGYLIGVMGSERSMLRIEAGIAMVGVPFAALLALRFGVNGAAVGIVLSTVCRTLAMWWTLGRRHSLWGLPVPLHRHSRVLTP